MRKFLGAIFLFIICAGCETTDPTVNTGTPKYPWPQGLNKNQFIEKYFANEDLDLVEGIYAGSNNRYEIAVIKNDFGIETGYDYLGILTDSNVRIWKKGEIKFKLKKTATPTIFTGNYYMGNKSRLGRTFFLKEGYLEVSLPTGYNFSAQPALFLKSYPGYEATQKKTSTSKKTKPSSGSAFFVDNRGHIITNYHVVETCNNKSKIKFNDKEYNVNLIAKDKYLDLALLKADINNNSYISLSNDAPYKLQKIIAAGYPFGKSLSDDLKFTSGIVSSLKGVEDDSTRLQIDAALNHGNSGGPIVDADTGELIAVAVSGLRKDFAESINFGIKSAQVKGFLESNQINTKLKISKLSSGGLSNHLEKSTIYTYCN